MTDLTAYQAAQNGAVFYHQPEAGFLRLSGADRADFIQRQSTNDLRHLTNEQFVMTVLTSAKARILDVLCLVDEGETLGVIPLPGRQGETAQFLQKRIFFSDQVGVENLSANFAQVLLAGSQATATLENLGMNPPPENFYSRVSWGAYIVVVIAQKILSGGGYHLISVPAFVDAIQSALLQAGAVSVNLETFETLRVECGRPGPAGELIADYTPLEVGYLGMISEAKGCYTGQEVIARQMTSGRIVRSLVGLKLAGSVAPGASLLVEGKLVGKLTSLVVSPRFGVIGLGVLRRKFCDLGTQLIAVDSGSGVNAEVVELPFSD